MIVLEQQDDSLILVRQADHAAGSAALARAWSYPSAAFPHDLWLRFVTALAHHDDGWSGEEEAPLLNAEGLPHDFKSYPTARHIAAWRETLQGAKGDPYGSLLIAQHARWLYTHFSRETTQQEQQLAQNFLDELTLTLAGRLEQLLEDPGPARLAVQPAALQVARRLFSFFDQLSLAVLGAIALEPRTEPLAFHHRESSLMLQLRPGDELAIEPWPFEGGSVAIEFPAIHVPRKRFSSSRDLAQAMARAPRRTLQKKLLPL